MKAVNGSGPPPTHLVKGGEFSFEYGNLDGELEYQKPALMWKWKEGFFLPA
jgi:hypothetical protein